MYGMDTNLSRYLFKEYKMLTLTSLYILEVICFIKKYEFSLQQNVHVHDHNIMKKNRFTSFTV